MELFFFTQGDAISQCNIAEKCVADPYVIEGLRWFRWMCMTTDTSHVCGKALDSETQGKVLAKHEGKRLMLLRKCLKVLPLVVDFCHRKVCASKKCYWWFCLVFNRKHSKVLFSLYQTR